jgi:hypothetical protein
MAICRIARRCPRTRWACRIRSRNSRSPSMPSWIPATRTGNTRLQIAHLTHLPNPRHPTDSFPLPISFCLYLPCDLEQTFRCVRTIRMALNGTS